MKAWAASLALHGAALGAAALLWLEPQVEPQASPLRWTVSFAPAPPAPQAAPVEPAAPTPPKRSVPREPAPSPAVPQRVAEAVATPAAAPAPAPQLPAVAPVAAAAPVAPPAPVVDTAAEVERRWYLALMERLRAMKRYPMVARRLGQEGVVLVEADIGRDGRLLGVALKRGSGYPLLDNDALRLIEAAAEAARSQLTPERPTRLQIPVAYKLES